MENDSKKNWYLWEVGKLSDSGEMFSYSFAFFMEKNSSSGEEENFSKKLQDGGHKIIKISLRWIASHDIAQHISNFSQNSIVGANWN